METPKSIQQEIKRNKRMALPYAILSNTISFGVGIGVGYVEGKGHIFDPATKYAILSTPAVVSGLFSLTMSMVVDKVLQKKEFQKSLDDMFTEEKYDDLDDEFKEKVKKTAYELSTVPLYKKAPKILVRNTGKTAVKTGVGYALGHGLAKLI